MANSLSINVYLKLKPDSQVSELIKEFNQFLEQQQIFTTYQITPYITQHPLHVTLYMARYKEEQIPVIAHKVEELAKQYKQLSILTSKFIPSAGGYVMLSVMNDSQIQGLSNKALHELADLRDKKARIPAWAAQDAGRKEIFNQFGSPTVLNYFNPHFSVFSANHLPPPDSARLYGELQKLVHDFAQTHRTQMRARAIAIGVGIANDQGQIVRELNSFSLM